jgi:hypothetical protein
LRAGAPLAPPLPVLPLLQRPGAALPAPPGAPLLQRWRRLRHQVDGLVHGHLAAAALLLKREQVLAAAAPVASGGHVKGWLGRQRMRRNGRRRRRRRGEESCWHRGEEPVASWACVRIGPWPKLHLKGVFRGNCCRFLIFSG